MGRVEEPRLDARAKKLRVTAAFSRNPLAQEVVRDLQDRILTHVSVGYLPERMTLVAEDKDKGSTYRVTRWSPVEMTIVNGVPADPTVGLGRKDDGGQEFAVEVEGDEPAKEEPQMKKVRSETGAVIEVADDDPRPEAKEVEVRADDKKVREVVAIASAYGYEKRISEFLEKGLDGNAVRALILDEVTAKPLKAPPAEVMDKKDEPRYSIARAILCQSEGRIDGLEAQTHQEIARRMTGLKYNGGVYVPTTVGMPTAKRALDSKTAAGAAELVFDQPGSLIELLRNKTKVIGLGATVLPGLQGPVPFPKHTGAHTAYWVGENGVAPTASAMTFGLATLIPKTLMATTAYSKQLLVQASVDVEGLVRNDLAAVHSIALDRAAIHGKGNDGEPCGVYMAQDVQSQAVTNSTTTYPVLLAGPAKVAASNALEGSLGYLTTPQFAAQLMTVLEVATVGTSFLWKGTLNEGTMCGYPAASSSNVSAVMATSEPTGGAMHGLIFGNWSDLLIGMWGGTVELLADPYTSKNTGLIEVTSFQMADVLLRRGVSFCKYTGCVLF